jgi:hypothetical protein
MATSVPCPECSRVLKSNNPIPPGQRLRCPGCQTTFLMPAKEASPIQAGKRTSLQGQQAKPTTLRGRDDDYDNEDEAPRRTRRDEDEFSERPRKKRRYDADEDMPPSRSRRDVDDDDWDDRPVKKRRKKGGAMAWILAGSGVGLLLVFALTAFVWPGFLRSPSTATSLEGTDLVALAPADVDFMVGINMAPTRNDPEMARQMDQALTMMAAQGIPPEVGDFVKDAERAMLAGKVAGNTFSLVAAVLTNKPYDAAKLKQLLKLDNSSKVQNWTIYKKPLPGMGVPPLLVCMDDPKVLIIGIVAEADFVKSLGNLGKDPVIGRDMLVRARELERSVSWGIVLNQGKIREGLSQIPPNPFLGELPEILKRARMASFGVELLPSRDQKVSITLDCSNSADAGKVKSSVDGFWNIGLAAMANQMPAEGQGLLTDLQNTFKVETRGAQVTASAQVSEKTRKQLEGFNPGMFGPMQKVRGAANKVTSVNNLRQIGAAIHDYHDNYKKLPGNIVDQNGRPLLSWRVAILPYMGQEQLYRQFDCSPRCRRLIWHRAMRREAARLTTKPSPDRERPWSSCPRA